MPQPTEMGGSNQSFPATAWSQIQAAGGAGEEAERALEFLCQLYWKPVYSYILQRVKKNELAKDLAQDFFLRLVSTRTVVQKADPAQGRFRTFLGQRVRWFLGEHFKGATAAADEQPLDAVPLPEPAGEGGPADEFDHACARQTVARALELLEDRYRAEGQARRLKVFELTQAGRTGEEVAQALAISPDTVKNELRAYRRDFAAALRAVVRSTVTGEREVEEELRELRRLLG